VAAGAADRKGPRQAILPGLVEQAVSGARGRSCLFVLAGELLPVGVKLHLKRVGDGLGVGEQRVDGPQALLAGDAQDAADQARAARRSNSAVSAA
jgi:hypothetical protein